MLYPQHFHINFTTTLSSKLLLAIISRLKINFNGEFKLELVTTYHLWLNIEVKNNVESGL